LMDPRPGVRFMAWPSLGTMPNEGFLALQQPPRVGNTNSPR
jgi:hypothetical protein